MILTDTILQWLLFVVFEVSQVTIRRGSNVTPQIFVLVIDLQDTIVIGVALVWFDRLISISDCLDLTILVEDINFTIEVDTSIVDVVLVDLVVAQFKPGSFGSHLL